MKKNLLTFILLFLAGLGTTQAYDFSAVAPSGQTLYYNIVNGNAVVTYQNDSYPRYTSLSGSLTIPAFVTYHSATYSVTSIGDHAFTECHGLTSVTIPNSVISIGSSAFYNCISLTSVTIPNSITTIGNNAFQGCNGLTSVTIPNSVTTIGNNAFQGCNGLTSVTIPNSVISIGSSAFWNCSNLTSVTIGSSVTTIGESTFALCPSLTSVTIGSSVTTIGDHAFYNCYSLTEITCLGTTAPTLGPSVFTGVTNTIPVNIPCGCTVSYQTAWSYFSNYNDTVFPYTLNVESNNETMGRASITTTPSCSNNIAVVAATPTTGYHFVHWSDGRTDNPRTLTVMQDTTIIAIFRPFNVAANNAMGGGEYLSGSTAVIFALPQVNLQFAGWSDGETANPRYIVVTSDTTLTALYRAPDTVRVYDTTTVYDTVTNIVYDTTQYNHYYYDTTRIYDTLVYVNIDTLHHYYYDTTHIYDTLVVFDTTRVFDTLVFVNIDTLHHYHYDTTRTFDTTVYVNVDTLHHYYYDTTRVFDTTVYVNVDTLHHYYYDTTRTFDTMVFVNVDTLKHYYFDTTSITHYVFDSTWVFDSVYIFDTIYLHDTIYVGGNAIGDVESVSAKIYQRDGQIVVEGAEGMPVMLYDATGRLLATRRNEDILGGTPLRLNVPASGTYLIKVGNHPARKVVVIR